MRRFLAVLLLAAAPSLAQVHATHTPPIAVDQPAPPQTQPPVPSDPLAPLNFLLGTWTASTTSAGSSGATGTGAYTFRRDLAGHALVRTSSADTCTGPHDFDCSHQDHLTIFADAHGLAAHSATIFALYLDSEGHVIYYSITTPDPHTAIFLSQGPPSIPHFRLVYHLEGEGPHAVMSGKFEGSAPNSDEFHPYLAWSGTRQSSTAK